MIFLIKSLSNEDGVYIIAPPCQCDDGATWPAAVAPNQLFLMLRVGNQQEAGRGYSVLLQEESVSYCYCSTNVFSFTYNS
jgi:hypothetical protein